MRLALLLSFACSLSATERYFEEKYPGWGQSLEVQKMVCSEKTGVSDIVIFENPLFGKVFTVNGAIQKTEKDEFIYHEMLVHPALISHGKPLSVLILGGADGGALREVLRHKDVQRAVLVESDSRKIDLLKTHMPSFSNGAFEDSRVEVIAKEPLEFLKDSKDAFEVILCDISGGTNLFTKEFFGSLKARLSDGGIVIHPVGAPFFQKDFFKASIKNRKPDFDFVTFYLSDIPSLHGGPLAFGWSSDVKHNAPLETLKKRLGKVTGKLKYFTPQMIKTAFQLPAYLVPQEKSKGTPK